MPEVYLGLGSNIDADRSLGAALAALQSHFGPLRASRVYRNPAIGFGGDDFLNLVAQVVTAMTPEQIQRELHALELAAGRDRAAPRFGPRRLDIDLLLYGSRVDPLRRLPREDVLRYAFVLGPLAELAPALVHPVTGETIAAAWGRHPGATLAWTLEGRSLLPAPGVGAPAGIGSVAQETCA